MYLNIIVEQYMRSIFNSNMQWHHLKYGTQSASAGFAPAISKCCTVSVWPAAAAHDRGVAPDCVSEGKGREGRTAGKETRDVGKKAR